MQVSTKVLVSVLFLSAIPLLSAPMVLSQNMITTTNTMYSPYSVATQTFVNRTIFLSNPLTVPARTERFPGTCYYFDYEFNSNGLQGSEIFGSLMTTSLIDLYIMTPSQFDDWTYSVARSCRGMVSGNALLIAQGIDSLYLIDWTVPSNYSTYYFIFFNSYAGDATLQVTLWTRILVTVFLPATATIFSTITQTATPSATRTQTPSPASLQTSTYSTPYPAVSPIPSWILTLIVVAIVALPIIYKWSTKPTGMTEPKKT